MLEPAIKTALSLPMQEVYYRLYRFDNMPPRRLLLLHGGGAHAYWWAHIAPFFAQTHRVVAMSMAGMGNSSWRETYAIEQHARDMRAVAEAAGLFDGAGKSGFPRKRPAGNRKIPRGGQHHGQCPAGR